MPLSKYFGGKGEEVMGKMAKEYGPKKAKRVFYATVNKRKKTKSFAKGGMVSATGKYKLHGGEMVLPRHMARKMSDMLMQHMMDGKFKK